MRAHVKTLFVIALAAGATVWASSGRAQVVGDAVRGKTAFAVCAACHSVVAGKNGMGPSLAGVVGRPAASLPGFKYSAAMKAAGPWTPASLDNFLTAPQMAVPGTIMPFAGVKDAQKRADIIAYLKTAP